MNWLSPAAALRAARRKLDAVLRPTDAGKRLRKGLPPGLDRALLDSVCRDRFDRRLAAVAHTHLSGWKASGAYRLFVTLRGGRKLTLIYKDADYNQADIPALAGFPVHPGPPEYTILSHAGGPLSDFLPAVFLARAVEPGRRYQYLQEDIRGQYYQGRLFSDRYVVVERLEEIHRALAETFPPGERAGLLQFDRQFSLALHAYARPVLERYLAAYPASGIGEALDAWDLITRAHLQEEFFDPALHRPVHGDLNFANVFLHKSQPGRLRLLDWEWAGVAPASFDLAALLKGGTWEVKDQFLSRYAKTRPDLKFEQVKRWYTWSLLERDLNDASFLAAQFLARPVITNFNIPRSIEKAALGAMDMARELCG